MASQYHIKSAEELELMRIAGKMASDCLDMIGEHVVAGVSTEHLDNLCHKFITEDCQAIPACLGYRGFPKSVCTSVNHVICHGIPNPKQKLKNGDIINIDVTVIHKEFHGDTSKMYIVGQPKPSALRLVELTQECLYLGINMIKPGVHLGDIGHAMQEFAHNHHYSVVRDYCGHGIGKNFHELPQVNHFGSPGTGAIIEEGMTFTIEPMLNMGTHVTKLLPDDWTVITKDRKLSAQWEHTMAVTKTGREIMTLRSDETIQRIT